MRSVRHGEKVVAASKGVFGSLTMGMLHTQVKGIRSNFFYGKHSHWNLGIPLDVK